MKKKTPATKKIPKTKAVAKKEPKEKIKAPWTQKQVALITRTVAKGATIDELHLFLYTANKVKLDPLAKQIHFTKYNTKDGPQMAVITGIDGYRAIAERSGTYAGSDDPVYDGGKLYEPGKEPNNPSNATATVYRMISKRIVAFTATARWKEYFPGEKKGFMWKKMPYLMLGKVAEALALRKAFPNDLSGLHTADEMAQADAIDVLPEPKADTPKVKPQHTQKRRTDKKVETPVQKEETPAEAVEGEIVEEEKPFRCNGCDIEISLSDKQLTEKLSSDGKPYCQECLKQFRKQ